MNQQQFDKMRTGRGFIAALDQSGGSTPKALKNYGVDEDAYSNDEEMFRVMHEMRSRIMRSPAFNGDRILGAILFEDTMNRQIEGRDSADYLWNAKNVVPIIKVDKGLADAADNVQLMKPIPGLGDLLERARDKANNRLSRNKGVVASFSRALTEGLFAQQSDEEFDKILDSSIQSIFDASNA